MQGYADRIVELLDSCADQQRHDPAGFLWNGRRALEAMCHLLLTAHAEKSGTQKPIPDGRSLDEMVQLLVKLGIIDAEQNNRFDYARRHANLGVHIRTPERETFPAAVLDMSHVLPELTDWLFDESIAAEFVARPPNLATEEIRDGGRERPPPREAIRLADARVEAARQELELALAERDAAKKRADSARAGMWGRVRVYAGSMAVTFVLGLGLGLLTHREVTTTLGGFLGAILHREVDASASLVVPASNEAVAPVSVPSPSEVAPASQLTTTTTPAPTPTPPPAPSCPAKMLLIPAIDGMRLGQPDRSGWPEAHPETLKPFAVPAFCIDPTPFRRSDYATSSVTAAASAKCAWTKAPKDGSPWTYCLNRQEAERACAAAVPSGQLPSLVQWESAVRARPDELTWPKQEWSSERFPTATLNRVDRTWSKGDAMWVKQLRSPADPKAATLMLSWNYQQADSRHVERTFRCVAPVVGG